MVGTIAEQIRIEEEFRSKHLQKYIQQLNKAIDGNRFNDTPEGLLLIKLGFLPFRDSIAKYLASKDRGDREQLKNFMKLLSDDPDELALTAINVVISSAASAKLSGIASIAVSIVDKLKDIHFFHRLKEDNPKLHSYLGTEYKKASTRRKTELVKKHIKKLYSIDFKGNISDKAMAVKIGTILIDLLIASGANLIWRDTITTGKHTSYALKFTADAQKILVDTFRKEKIMLGSNMLPMIVEPLEWEEGARGGYYVHEIELVKTRTKQGKKFVKENGLNKIYPVINKLQSVAWRINPTMLDLITDVFENNMIDPSSPKSLPRCYGGIPSSEIYRPKDLLEPQPKFDDGTPEDLKIWGDWNKRRERIKIALDAENSRRMDFVSSLGVAYKMVDYDKIWFVLQCDYRGRVYYHNQFFNPQSREYVKSMLEFADGKHLNDIGIKWLKIHTANVFGMDKEELEDRIKWFDDNMSDILKIASDPINNKSLWADADSPFEYVSACLSWKRHTEGLEVHLPAQADATNSGIQFYSGLVLDADGGSKVNVINKVADGRILRADIYKDVADKVNHKLLTGAYQKSIPYKDSEGVSHERWTWKEAQSIAGKITRSHTKKNTMTVAYSVTIDGMKRQNWDTMRQAELENKVFWEGDAWVVNKLITVLNEESIFESIVGARMGQKYLKQVAGKLKDVATWKSPLYDFPVLQPSFKEDVERINTPLGKLTIKYSNEVELNKSKQASSIAANFIHSLDSSLLMYCVDNSVDGIGVIHDCFLVHPNDMELLRTNYREGYVKIMETNPLKTFQDGLNLSDKDFVEIPVVGTLNLKDVLDSKYIVS